MDFILNTSRDATFNSEGSLKLLYRTGGWWFQERKDSWSRLSSTLYVKVSGCGEYSNSWCFMTVANLS